MNAMHRVTLLTGTGCLLLGIMTLTQAPPVNAAPSSIQQVAVVNTEAQAVPVSAQGTTAVAGEVAVANMPGGSLTEPFGWSSTYVFFDQPFPCVTSSFTVPAGKLLVIESVSAFGRLDVGTEIEATVQVSGATHALPAVVSGDGVGSDGYVASQAVRMYAAPSSYVGVTVCANTAFPGDYARGSVGGYLVTSQ